MSTSAPPQAGAAAVERKPKGGPTERAKAERKLAWMLCAPAVGLMFTTRMRTCPAVTGVFASVVVNPVTAPPPVPPVANSV